MPFNIRSFSADFSKNGYLQNNKFDVYITPPPAMRNAFFNETALTISKRIQSISLPSLELIAIENQRYGVGPPQKYAVTSRFNDISINMIVARNSFNYIFFYDWYNTVVNSLPSEGLTGGGYRYPRYVVEYKDNYSSTMQIKVYDNTGTLTKNFNFYDVYPLNLAEIPLSWKSQNEMLELNVLLTFKDLTSL